MAKKILIVDDEPDILKAAAFRLKQSGYEIISAVDGQAALDLTKEKRPDLILLDLVLPLVSGFDVCRRLKADKEFKNIPIIIFTASASEISEKTREAGADDYITKPFEPDELIAKIKKFIG